MLVRVVAPHYTAGLIIKDGIAVRAAPILYWAVKKRKTREWLSAYFKRKGFKATILKM